MSTISSNNNNNNNDDENKHDTEEVELETMKEEQFRKAATFNRLHQSKWLLTALILLLGCAASAAFLSLGINSANQEKEEQFERQSEDVTFAVQTAWHDYELFGLWIHESCFKSFNRSETISAEEDVAAHLGFCSRAEFRRLYEHVASTGIRFQSAQFLPNITHDVREAIEAEARLYYQENYPYVDYQGIKGLDQTSDSCFSPLPEHPFYFPIHYVEPVLNNENAIELDSFSLRSTQRHRIRKAVSTWKPVLSTRLKLVQETDPNAYGIILQHPGIQPSDSHAPRPTALSQVVIRVPSLIDEATRGLEEEISTYIYDSTDADAEPEFLGAVLVHGQTRISLPETTLNEISHSSSARVFRKEVSIADRQWTIAVVSENYNSDLVFIVLGGTILLVGIIILTFWFHSHLARVDRINQLHAQAEAEKAENAAAQVARERQLNEFIAHEVRNPLSSAISALSFVKTGAKEPVQSEESRQTMLQDIGIMEGSLQFIDELLRNMLDAHKAASKQVKLQLGPVDVARDVFEPVKSVLYLRFAKVDILIDCPDDLYVMSDRMRLKQIIVNLASNATKFVQNGYIRLHAQVVDGIVVLAVEDSGPGIPRAKRDRLFARFQESLDLLNQGTGIGLSVCKNLSELMGARIFLDDSFDSGIEGCPGTRFVLCLNQPPLDVESSLHGDKMARGECDQLQTESQPLMNQQLPTHVSVLFVDDDLVLRKMFCRAVRRIAPEWDIQEASNGETALRVVETQPYDIIFMDQYMASVEKQLLGTETVREMRSNGVSSIICGLSANDSRQQFLDAGANEFMSKPFPCGKEDLKRELLRVLSADA